MRSSGVAAAILAGLIAVYPVSTAAQQAPDPAEPASELPPVEVIQKKAAPAPTAQPTTAPPPQAAVSPAPQAPADDFRPELELDNPIYGSPASAGATERATESATTPVNPTQLLPSSLEDFSSAATIVDKETITERQPTTLNDLLTRVPGVTVINDDSAAHHGGIGIHGAPPRRSRKMLVMEDGHAVNLALWLDPSVHYWAPLERLEGIEVLRGTIITHGPNNNFGVINSRNLSPFGPEETVISSAFGWTQTRRGSFQEIEGAGAGNPPVFGDIEGSRGDDTDYSARWHVHTRQHADNVGLVASYTGHSIQGAWDTERLRVHDFYGALGWKGSSSDLVVSAMHARQRDNYDEQNFLGNYELGDFNAATEDDAVEAAELLVAQQFLGLAEQQFKQLKHCKTCFAPAAGLNNYNGEIWRGQIVLNNYLDENTTITSRLYAGYHRRDRYQLNTYEANPDGSPGGVAPEFEGPDGMGESEVFFGENTMFGRLRTFRHVGGEVRGELANQHFLGFKQDLQAGIRYEYQDMTNRNFLGRENEILGEGDEEGATIFDRSLQANTVSAFLQTNVHVAKDFNVVPGVRFEWLNVSRQNSVIAREESEAGGGEDDDCQDALGIPDCLDLDGLLLDPSPASESFSNFNVLPGIAFAYTGLYRTTVFGGWHRGLTTQVLRNEDFPGKDEIGDNFNLGLRSSAFTGLDFEVAGFYHLIENYQFGASFSNVAGDRSFGLADEVEISGVDLHGRLNSQPFTGGSLNFFGEGRYTYSRGVFTDLTVDGENFNGNRIPEVPWHVAALTLGVQQTTGWRWDASVTWTYRGKFFTDEGNTPLGAGGEVECEDEGGNMWECEFEEAGEDGMVPSVWLLSARFNLDIGDTGASVFVSGHNLLDEFYIADREDGMKPGLGRTFWTGFKYKF